MIENVARQSEAEGLPRSRLEQFDEHWIQRIKGTSDFLGINHYTTFLVTGPGVDPTAKSPSWLKDIGAVTTMEVGGDSASEWLRVNYLLLTHQLLQKKYSLQRSTNVHFFVLGCTDWFC